MPPQPTEGAFIPSQPLMAFRNIGTLDRLRGIELVPNGESDGLAPPPRNASGERHALAQMPTQNVLVRMR